MTLKALLDEVKATSHDVLEQLKRLVVEGQVSIVSPEWQTNTHIKMIEVPAEIQLKSLGSPNASFTCLYPTAASVSSTIDVKEYDDRPFTKMLLLAKPQLEAMPFRLDLLDRYDDDARYDVRFYDFGGHIDAKEGHYNEMKRSGELLMVRFGIGYDQHQNRILAVYLCDLHLLPAREQRIWQEYLADGMCQMDNDYFRTTILAEFPEHVSTYEAIIHLQVEINRLADLMGRPPLFRETYEDHRRPRGFSFFVRPTRGEYLTFVQLFDKMLSDNLSHSFFGDDAERFRMIQIRIGVFERQEKGSLTVLEDWLTTKFPEATQEQIKEILAPLREVRAQRQKPSHKIVQDEYDPAYYVTQDELVTSVYEALKSLHSLMMTDPSTSSYKLPAWISDSKIKSY